MVGTREEIVDPCCEFGVGQRRIGQRRQLAQLACDETAEPVEVNGDDEFLAVGEVRVDGSGGETSPLHDLSERQVFLTDHGDHLTSRSQQALTNGLRPPLVR